MDPAKEKKPTPPIDVSLNYMSWSIKDFTKMMMQFPSLMEQTNKRLEDINTSINRLADILLAQNKESPF